MKLGGIYKIVNLINNKIYVGSTTTLNSRKYGHFYLLKNNKHPNKHLQASWNKYGENTFVFEIIEVIESLTKKKLEKREQYWIDFYTSSNSEKGYNIRKLAKSNIGIIPWNRDKWKNILSEDDLIYIYLSGYTINFISKSFSIDVEIIRKILNKNNIKIKMGLLFGPLNPLKGRKIKSHVLKALLKSHKGKPGQNKGRKFSEEWRNNMSLCRLGKPTKNKDSWKIKVSEQELINLYIEGYSILFLGKKFKMDRNIISMVLKKNNIPIKRYHRSRKYMETRVIKI